MEKNVGKTDAMIRIVVGLVALYLAFVASAWWLIVAAIAFVTAMRKSCWFYQLFGMNTAEKKVEAKPIKKAKRK